MNNLLVSAASPLVLFTPVIELDFGQERFLTDHPMTLFESKEYLNVPIMAGITENEYISLAICEYSPSTFL